MTHTSTEQENKEALDVASFLSKYADAPSCQATYHLKRLVARVQELEAQAAHMADLVELADYATKKLEASQAQRAPLTDEEKQNLLKEWSYSQFTGNGDFLDGVEAAERAHGITQEKQV